MTKARLEAFSDGVFAVAITLLILDVQPESVGLTGWQMLSHDWHKILVYLLSFVIVGAYWVAHHNLMHFVTAVDRTLLWLNLLLLLAIVFIPYVAALLSASHADPSAMRIYGTTLILINLAGTTLWGYATELHRLVNPALPPSFIRFVLCIHTAPVLVYGLAIALASWNPIISLILFAVVPAFLSRQTRGSKSELTAPQMQRSRTMTGTDRRIEPPCRTNFMLRCYRDGWQSAGEPVRWSVSSQDWQMKISFVQPRQELQQFIESFWVFESAVGMPATDTSMAAPNGCPRLVIPYENSLVATWDGRSHITHEQGLYFVGNRDKCTLLHSEPRKTGFIVIEFVPHGAFSFFGIPMQETSHGLFDAGLVFGRWGRDTQEVLRNLESVNHKVDFIQSELIRLLRKNPVEKGVVDFCVRSLKACDGRIAITELERQTGYSRRYLDLLFEKHVGLPPKVVGRIFRFHKFYRKWAKGLPYDVLKHELHDDYYDQAHFTREFKRIMGYSPRAYTREVSNEFGRRITLR